MFRLPKYASQIEDKSQSVAIRQFKQGGADLYENMERDLSACDQPRKQIYLNYLLTLLWIGAIK